MNSRATQDSWLTEGGDSVATSFVRGLRLLVFALALFLSGQPAAQAQQSYAPLVVWNVPNFYPSTTYPYARYDDPLSAFTVDWELGTTQQCGRSGLYRQ